jgi:uncharacterized protein YqiB (DUF1249 family)
MLRTARQRIRPLPSRFAYLMGMYAENYWRLARVFGPERLERGRFLSAVGDGLDLSLEVLELHRYTIDLKLSYLFPDEASGSPEPSAHVRVYRDARMAEVTTCYVGPRLEDVLGRYPPPQVAVDHRLRMSSFLGKWLEYLEERGHSRFTLRPGTMAAT